MNKLKKLVIFLGGFIIFLYALFILAPLVISPILNSKSEIITKSINDSTGFDAQLNGITLVTSWNFSAGIKVKELKLTVPNSKKPFFYAKNTGLKLSLLPVLNKKIQLDSLFCEDVYADLIVKKDGRLELLDYLPEQKDKPKESFNLPMGIKLSNNLPSIYVDSYRLAIIDKRTDRSYFMEGEDFKVTNFVLDKRVKFSSRGKVVFDNETICNYDLKIDNRIMPNINLHDLVFPADIVVEGDKEPAKQVNEIILTEYIDILEKIKNNQISSDINANIKIEGTIQKPKLNGTLKLNKTTIAVNNKKLPESNIDMTFKNHKTSILSTLYTSNDKDEKTIIEGQINSGKNKLIDISVKSNAKFQNIIDLADSIASSFNIKDLNTLSATGRLDANFKINSDFKKVSSNGYLKILPSSLNYGLYNISIKDITADIDLKNNDIIIKKSGFSILGQPLRLEGSILADTTTNLTLTANKLSIKGLLLALGQTSLLKENNINTGVISLNALIKGKLQEIKPEISVLLENINAYNKPAAAKITLPKAVSKIFYDGKTAFGNIDINSLGINITGANISVPKALVDITPDKIDIKNSYMMLNSSRIDVTGQINNYLNDKTDINIKAKGALQSSGITAFLPKEFRNLITYKGQLPVNIHITGNTKVQNIAATLTANPNNYISLIDIGALKGQTTKIQSNIELNGDTLTFTNTSLSNNKTQLAKVSGGITKLYSMPKLNLTISVPNNISFPIWGVPHSNITANGTVNVTGGISDPQLKGTVSISDLSMKDMKLEIKNLVADLAGSILNGSASAKLFKFDGIVATDLTGKFSLKEYSKFYLTDAKAKSFDGNITGKLSYDINTTKIGSEFTGVGLNSAKAVEGAVGIKNALTGTMGFDGKLTMQGLTDREIINSMKGNLNFNVKDGRFVSIGKLENLVAAQNITSNAITKSAISALSTLATAQESDRFKTITGEMSFAGGTAQLSKILVSGPMMSYHVKGNYYIIPNSANLIILGRLDSKVVSCLGPLGQLSADKLLSYIPKFGTTTAAILKQMTSDPNSENTALIPQLSSGSTAYKDFKVVYNGPVESASSVKSFKWLSTCDISEMNLKQDLQNAKEAVKENITNRVEDTVNKVENVQKNVTNIVETKKQQVEQAKKDFQQAKEQTKQNIENIKNLFKGTSGNSNTQTQSQTQTPTSTTTTETKTQETVTTAPAQSQTTETQTQQQATPSTQNTTPATQSTPPATGESEE